jgi:radical SAM protein with 4Fe4S-binding SPASM domain
MVPPLIKKVVYALAERSLLVRKQVDRYRGRKLAARYAGRAETSPRAFALQNVELTNKCPMRCVMCARTNNMMREQGLMTFEVFKTVIDQFVKDSPAEALTHDTWLHHFGESLVHPDFARFVRYAVSKGVKACMSVNPIMLTPAIADELLDTGISKLYISLDGHDDESFYKIRGVKDAYEKSKTNLLEFLRKKSERGAKTRIVLSMINFGLNRDSIARQRAYWESVPGIDEYLCKAFITWNGDAADVNKLADAQVDNDELRKRYPTPACNVPWETLSVTWDGEVVPCCFDYDKKYPLGNLKDKTLSEIWNGERMKSLRREFLNNDVRNELCRRCTVLYPPDSPPSDSEGTTSESIAG